MATAYSGNIIIPFAPGILDSEELTYSTATILTGSEVLLEGLLNKPYWNGCIGEVVRIFPTSDRIGVRLKHLETPQEPISVKRSNLVQPVGSHHFSQREAAHCVGCGYVFGIQRLQKCGNCRRVQYCSKECQRHDWPVHTLNCKVLRMSRKETDASLPSIHNIHDRMSARMARISRHLETGNFAEAEHEARQLIEECPEELRQHCVYTALAMTLLKQERFDEALPFFNQAVETPLGPQESIQRYAESHNFRGVLYYRRKNDRERAKDAFLAALRINPQYHHARRNLQCMARNGGMR